MGNSIHPLIVISGPSKSGKSELFQFLTNVKREISSNLEIGEHEGFINRTKFNIIDMVSFDNDQLIFIETIVKFINKITSESKSEFHANLFCWKYSLNNMALTDDVNITNLKNLVDIFGECFLHFTWIIIKDNSNNIKKHIQKIIQKKLQLDFDENQIIIFEEGKLIVNTTFSDNLSEKNNFNKNRYNKIDLEVPISLFDAFYFNPNLGYVLKTEARKQCEQFVQQNAQEKVLKLDTYLANINFCMKKKTVLLAGNMGVGKSTLGNKLLKSNLLYTSSLAITCTTSFQFYIGDFFVILDQPGLDTNIKINWEEKLIEGLEFFNETKEGIDLLIFCFESRLNLQDLLDYSKCFGKDILKRTLLVQTKCDSLNLESERKKEQIDSIKTVFDKNGLQNYFNESNIFFSKKGDDKIFRQFVLQHLAKLDGNTYHHEFAQVNFFEEDFIYKFKNCRFFKEVISEADKKIQNDIEDAKHDNNNEKLEELEEQCKQLKSEPKIQTIIDKYKQNNRRSFEVFNFVFDKEKYDKILIKELTELNLAQSFKTEYNFESKIFETISKLIAESPDKDLSKYLKFNDRIEIPNFFKTLITFISDNLMKQRYRWTQEQAIEKIVSKYMMLFRKRLKNKVNPSMRLRLSDLIHNSLNC